MAALVTILTRRPHSVLVTPRPARRTGSPYRPERNDGLRNGRVSWLPGIHARGYTRSGDRIQETPPSGGLSENPALFASAIPKSIRDRDAIGIDPRSIFKAGGSAARIVLMGMAAFSRSTDMATGDPSI